MEWLVLLALLIPVAAGFLVWRDRRRGRVCPWCGDRDTFGVAGDAAVCSNCGFDFRSDDY